MKLIHSKHDDWTCECGGKLDDQERCPIEGLERYLALPADEQHGILRRYPNLGRDLRRVSREIV